MHLIKQIEEIKVLVHQEQSSLKENIFRAYDIRGIYPEDFDEKAAFAIGIALANKASNDKRFVVAMDGRLSSSAIKNSLISGLLSGGVDVIDCGMLPTPLLYFATYYLGISNGLMITGSHNPKNYNGIKMIIDGDPLFDKDIYALRDWITNNQEKIKKNHYGKLSCDESILENYINRVINDLDIKTSKKFIVDCMNGVTGNVVKKIFDSFNIQADYINLEVDGNFPNCSPDPTKETNLESLKKHVKDANADYGVAFDGDGDRTVIIKNDGSVLWPDELMIIFAKSILKEVNQAKIVFDVKCTMNLRKSILESNGVPIECRTGHSYIKTMIKQEKAMLGGEMSGHIFFNDKWYGFDDGIYVFLRFLEILTNNDELTRVIDELPKTYASPELDINFNDNGHFEFMDKFMKTASFDNYTISNTDGIKILNQTSWGLIRPSNTSPKITLRFESSNEDDLKTIKNDIKNAILKIDNTLDLPF